MSTYLGRLLYLKAITLDYNRPIDILTIFSHATAGNLEMSEAFNLTEQTAPLLSRLRNENILAANATILLFGCEAGKGDSGLKDSCRRLPMQLGQRYMRIHNILAILKHLLFGKKYLVYRKIQAKTGP